MNASDRHTTTMGSMRRLYSTPAAGQKEAPKAVTAAAGAEQTTAEATTINAKLTAKPQALQSPQDAGQQLREAFRDRSATSADIELAYRRALKARDRWVGDHAMAKIREMLEGRTHG